MGFAASFREVMASEGTVETNDPNDPGGQTYCGISRNENPWWQGWAVIDACKRSGLPTDCRSVLSEMVTCFYREEFWDKLRCEEICKMSDIVAGELFEASVNCGRKNGVRFLQRALNRLNVNGTLYQDIEPDGAIGKDTLGAVALCLKKSVGEKLLFRCQNGEQYLFYINNPKHERYRGWFART